MEEGKFSVKMCQIHESFNKKLEKCANFSLIHFKQENCLLIVIRGTIYNAIANKQVFMLILGI